MQINQYPNITNIGNTDLLLVQTSSDSAYKSIKGSDAISSITSNVAASITALQNTEATHTSQISSLQSSAIVIPTTIKTVSTSTDYFIGIDSTGALYKITYANLTAGLSSGGSSSSSSSGLLLDNISGVISAYSCRQLRTGYTGKALQAVLSGGSTQDIGFVSNILDTASLNTFRGSNTASAKIFYDQIGSNNLSQSTFASAPTIVPGTSISTLNFVGQNLISTTVPSYPVTIIAVVKITGNTNGAFVKCGSTSNGIGIGVGSSTFDNSGVNITGLNETIAWIASSSPISTTKYAIVELNATGSATNVLLNGSQIASGSNSNSPTSDYYLGGYSTRMPTCQIAENIVLSGVISGTTRASLVSNIASFYGIS